MIVVDTSALAAIYLREPDADIFFDAIVGTDRVLMGAPSAFEFRLVAYKRVGISGMPDAERLFAQSPIEIVPWSSDLVVIATDALVRFGGRPASLNYGDCMAYALAKSLDVPLLYKGGDFAGTDIRSAL